MTIDQIKELALSGRTIEAEAQLMADFSISETSAKRTIHKMFLNETVTGAELVRPLAPYDGQTIFDTELQNFLRYDGTNWRYLTGVIYE